jgi:hypothetical protein
MCLTTEPIQANLPAMEFDLRSMMVVGCYTDRVDSRVCGQMGINDRLE